MPTGMRCSKKLQPWTTIAQFTTPSNDPLEGSFKREKPRAIQPGAKTRTSDRAMLILPLFQALAN